LKTTKRADESMVILLTASGHESFGVRCKTAGMITIWHYAAVAAIARLRALPN